MLFLLLPFLFLYPYYVVGMSEYVKLNYVSGAEEVDRCWLSVIDEFKELREEVNNKNVISSLLEFGDVVHSFVRYLITKYGPNGIFKNWWIWLITYWLSPLTGAKHGYRYFMHRCIRHKNHESHKCFYR